MKNKDNIGPSAYPRELFLEWYHYTPAGKILRDSEVSYFLNSLQLTYYQRILQVGSLGIELEYIGDEFRRNFALIPGNAGCSAPSYNLIRAKIQEWPIASESVDIVILPHLVEFESDPHQVLGEAQRVLKPEGRLFLLGFNPWSLSGLIRFKQPSPASWNTHFVACPQMMYWLNLLKFECEFNAGFGLSSSRVFIEPQSVWEKSIAGLASVYAVKAIKRKWTPISLIETCIGTPGLVPGQAMTPTVLIRNQR